MGEHQQARRAYVMLALTTLSMIPLNVCNVLSNEEIPSMRLIGLSGLLTAGALLRASGAVMFIPEIAFLAASKAVSTAVTPEVSSWSDGISWFNHIRIWMEIGHNREGPWVCQLQAHCRFWYMTSFHLEIARQWKGVRLKAGLLE